MADAVLALLVITALAVATGWLIRGLTRYTARLDGKGNASAPGSPDRYAGLCGASGPAGMRCDIPPHTDRRHEHEGCGWYEQDPDWRPLHLGETPFKPGGAVR